MEITLKGNNGKKVIIPFQWAAFSDRKNPLSEANKKRNKVAD